MLSNDMREEFSGPDYSEGVDPNRLDACLAQIRTEECNSPAAELERLRVCRTSALCA